MRPTFIDPTFRRAVEAHLAGNLIVTPTNSPLILAIFGPPGEGKTFQVDQICREYDLKVSLISPGELESENAGHPGQLIRKEYLRAGTDQHRGILVINDIDTVLGNWGSLVQYTVNRQVVFGQLMALCDYPEEVAGARCERVPIIVTGNNPNLLYGPLLRPGRARIFEWAPTREARIPIVAEILPELSLQEIERLVDEFPDSPTSFWTDVRAAVWERRLAEWAAEDDGKSLQRAIHARRNLNAPAGLYRYDSVAAAAKLIHDADIREMSYSRLGGESWREQ